MGSNSLVSAAFAIVNMSASLMYCVRLPGLGWLPIHCGPRPWRSRLQTRSSETCEQVSRVVTGACHDIRFEKICLLSKSRLYLRSKVPRPI